MYSTLIFSSISIKKFSSDFLYPWWHYLDFFVNFSNYLFFPLRKHQLIMSFLSVFDNLNQEFLSFSNVCLSLVIVMQFFSWISSFHLIIRSYYQELLKVLIFCFSILNLLILINQFVLKNYDICSINVSSALSMLWYPLNIQSFWAGFNQFWLAYLLIILK